MEEDISKIKRAVSVWTQNQTQEFKQQLDLEKPIKFKYGENKEVSMTKEHIKIEKEDTSLKQTIDT